MEFANKEYLLLLLLLIPYIIWYFLYKKGSEPTMRMSNTFTFQHTPRSWKVRLAHLPMLLRCVVYAQIVLVLARPQSTNPDGHQHVQAITFMLLSDVSASVLSDDV